MTRSGYQIAHAALRQLLPRNRLAQPTSGSIRVFGHDAVIWSSSNITYVLVGREPRETLEAVAKAMESAL